MDDRLVELESRLAFQDHTIQELNDVITQQQQQLDLLRVEVERLKQQIKEIDLLQTAPASEEALPPHY